MINYYKVLGITDYECPQSEIKDRFRARVLELHPDKKQVVLDLSGFFVSISLLYEAWRVLGEPGLRKSYDEQLRKEARIFYENSQYYESVSLKESGTLDEKTGDWILVCVQCGDSMGVEKSIAEKTVKECPSCGLKVLLKLGH